MVLAKNVKNNVSMSFTFDVVGGIKLGLKNTCVSVNPTDPVFFFFFFFFFFCADPAIFIAFQKRKSKTIFIPTNPKMFQKIGQKSLKMPELQN